MADHHTFFDLGRFLLALRRLMPGVILRTFISREKFLASVEIAHFNQGAFFVTDIEDAGREIHGLGFSILNFTPFEFTIVGASIRIVLNSIDLQRFEQRFPSSLPVTAYSRSGFYIQQELSEFARTRLKKCTGGFTYLSLRGYVYLQTPYGELQKEVTADVPLLLKQHRIPMPE